MTDHSDLIAELQGRAVSYRLGGPSSEHTALLLDRAADALSSQSLSLSEAREAVIAECLAAIDALKDFVPANPKGRVRFSIYDLTRAFRAGISMAREDVAALVSGSREDGADA